uniref:Putative secreted protein n=1 Tax=Ixodes ricinus TaxID=34613 RepID=A0A6B0UB92_IXORI
MRLKVMGHLSCTLMAVCSTPSSLGGEGPMGGEVGPAEKLRLILLMLWSAGSSRLRSRPCSTDRTVGRCTSCSRNRCEQQQAVTVICTVFRPAWHTSLR